MKKKLSLFEYCRLMSLGILGFMVCGIVGLSIYPTSNWMLNALLFTTMGILAFCQVKDLIKIHFAEKAHFIKEQQKMKEREEHNHDA